MNRFEGLLRQLNTDALLVLDYSNIMYACGFKADYAYLLHTATGKYYFTDSRFTLEGKEMLTDDYTVVEVNSTTCMDIIAHRLRADKVSTIAFDSDVSHSKFTEISSALGAEFALIDATQQMLGVRQSKADDEVQCIIKAQQIAEKSLQRLLLDITDGVSERQLAARLEYLMRINGSDGYSFPSIVAFGANSAFAHARPSDRRLAFGDIILIDFGATYGGYCSDMTRTMVYGSCNDEVMALYTAVLDANTQCIAAIKPGMLACDVDSLARNILATHGVDKLFTHSLGHGVGIDIHESPYLAPKSRDLVLTPGMVITIEPGVYMSGLGGIRIEDMVLLTDDGAVNLTSYPKTLTVIEPLFKPVVTIL